MNLTHRFFVPATLDAAWATFSRLDLIAPCFPGALVSRADHPAYTGRVKIKFGPVPLVYSGTARLTEVNEAARRMVVEATAHDRRGNGSATATVTATFTASGTITDIQVLSDLTITGRPAQFGARVIGDVSDRLLDLFVDCLSEKFRSGSLTADLTAADRVPTVELPPVEESSPEPAGTSEVGSEASSEASKVREFARPRTSAPPYVYSPPSNEAEPHLQVFGTVVPSVLKRFWPFLLGGAAVLGVAAAIVRRARA